MAIRIFATDIDGTLMGRPEALDELRWRWSQLDPQRRPILCYNSGRLLEDVLRLIRAGRLPEPNFIISGVGTKIYDYGQRQVLKAFDAILEDGWDPDLVTTVMNDLDMGLTRQPEHHQNRFKSSWYLDQAAREQLHLVEKRLKEAGLDVHVVYSSDRHLDILPRYANKGNALRWLLRRLNIEPDETVIAGDSGNDIAAFLIEGVHGIVVGNAQKELYQATKHLPIYHADADKGHADGLLSGLLYYGVLDEDDASAEREWQEHAVQQDALAESLTHSDRQIYAELAPEELALIREGYYRAIEALKKNITPMGFSAASLEDNEAVGTDANYRSVWARDGAVAIMGSLPLVDEDPEIRQCHEQTLETILAHVSPIGHVPANVRIDTGMPDYSGVGGIAAVDGGMLLVMAFYEYVRSTGCMDLLRKHARTLQRVMDWLSALDSNNDALLEIPEAGDWTDLFGRSYNVLYDEVLWYRTNICFGRLLELLGESDRAGDYMRWSQVIKREILANFWPTTEQRVYQMTSFAEQQYAVGDARYLLAQITPFGYSWRCDTYGNLLAYLYDVIGSDKASQAFRFMWGVGVSEPYPIVNLYPAVMAGDKDWREYYTVNLLNLPDHYHNGGIWPFIGGAWVRFVHKLGLRGLALKDLYRLAELNSLGVLHEWEFNEWAHGKTGRPMGKAYQAWSASEYILACHDLDIVP
jgi:sucrose-6-phosphatase